MPDDCCTSTGATALGYSTENAAAAPEAANLGLGCGNPLAIASLKDGQVVWTLVPALASIVFYSSRSRKDRESNSRRYDARDANESTRETRKRTDLQTLSSASVKSKRCPWRTSSPEKQPVFNEAFRVLKSGGRLAVADMVATAALPDDIKADWVAYAGCMAGASQISELEQMLRSSDFKDISALSSENGFPVKESKII